MHSMRVKKGRRGFIALKVDLEKAYVKISSTFLQDTIIEVGLPSNLIRTMMNCVSFVSMQVVWNEELSDSF